VEKDRQLEVPTVAIASHATLDRQDLAVDPVGRSVGDGALSRMQYVQLVTMFSMRDFSVQANFFIGPADRISTDLASCAGHWPPGGSGHEDDL